MCSFVCSKKEVVVSILEIANKVKFEAFFWGAGTALGELPPYFIARASRLSGRKNDEIAELEDIKTKPVSKRTRVEKAHLLMYNIVNYLGFFGILACASVVYFDNILNYVIVH